MITRRTLGKGTLSLAAALALPAVKASAADTIRIGAPVPLTGGIASEGVKQKNGFELWAETVNAAGGIKVGSAKSKVEIVYYDYESATPKAVQLTEKLISGDKVNFLFSPYGSGAAKAAASLSMRYKIVTISPSASSKEVFSKDNPYLFGVLTDNGTGIRSMVAYLKEHAPQIKKIAIYARNDLLGLSMANAANDGGKAGGYDIVYFEKYPLNATDHSAGLSAIVPLKPDWVFVTGYTDDLILIRKQMADLRLTPPVVTMIAGPAYPDFTKSLGPLANGVTSQAYWFSTLKTKSTDLFGSTESYAKAYQAKYGAEPDYASAAASAAGIVLQTAIERAGTIETEAVRKAIATGDFNTFYQDLRFGEDGQNANSASPVFQIQDGKITILAPADNKQGDFRLMK
jgi:branched-chain amino acid transport system substrate-binding protein